MKLKEFGHPGGVPCALPPLDLPMRSIKSDRNTYREKTPCIKNATLQGLFAVCIRVGSGDPVRVLSLLHNKYAGYN